MKDQISQSKVFARQDKIVRLGVSPRVPVVHSAKAIEKQGWRAKEEEKKWLEEQKAHQKARDFDELLVKLFK